jgi:RNA 2',3'-cyclic 3'-phosphodiesterase
MPDHPDLKPAERTPETARVFFALWSEEAVRRRLAEEAKRLHTLLGGRQTRTDTLHLTLLFIGQLARDRLPDLQAAVRQLQAPAFELVFDQADCWRHNRIAFLGASQPPEALFALVSGLEGAAAGLGIPFDRRAYKAHITLVRNARCMKKNPAAGRASLERITIPPPAPVSWRASDFVLVESRLDTDGARYALLERFSLS